MKLIVIFVFNSVAKPATKPKANGKGKAVKAKGKPRIKQSSDKDKKKGKVDGKRGIKTKKDGGAKESMQKGKRVPKHPNSKLTPNLDIVVVTKDPMFELKYEIVLI